MAIKFACDMDDKSTISNGIQIKYPEIIPISMDALLSIHIYSITR